VVASWSVPRAELSGGVALGGLSDLAILPAGGDGGRRFWAVTDRGPNGSAKVDGRKVRTLLVPEFAPSMVLLRCPSDGDAAEVERIVPLARQDGGLLSGRPPGDDVLVDDRDRRRVAGDPQGVDPEGLVAAADGTFWIAEEYLPALLHVDAAGKLIARFVPEGFAATETDRDVLPAIYARRRENRGFEAVAMRPDGGRLWAILQSPLDAPGRSAGKRTGNVRLLAFDPVAGVPVAEHVYRLGDPAADGFSTRGAPPDDGKLCAMAALDADTLLVLEQDDDGLARLYAADLAAATDTLSRDLPDGQTLEQMVDLPAAGIVAVTKSLVADLTELRERMRAECDGGDDGGGALKLEGLAIVDGRHVAVVDDNDFAVPQSKSRGPGRDTRLWIVELPSDLRTRSATP
jgi:hypothetical protein